MRSNQYFLHGLGVLLILFGWLSNVNTVHAQSGAETRVMVTPFSGPKSKRARIAAKDALEDEGYEIVSFVELEVKGEAMGIAPGDSGEVNTLASSFRASVVVSGKVQRGKRWSAVIEVHTSDGDTLGHWEASARSNHKLYKKIEKEFWKNLGESVEQAVSAASSSPKGTKKSGARAADEKGNARGSENAEVDEVYEEKPPALDNDASSEQEERISSDAVVPARSKLRIFELQSSVGSYTRQLAYNRGTVPAAENYDLPFSAAVYARVAWYPFAGMTRKFMGHVGLDLRGHLPFVFQAQDSLGNELDSFSYGGGGGLRFRLPIGRSEIAFVGGAGVHSFLFGDPEESTEAAFPSSQYVFGRVALESRWQMGRIFSLHADLAWLPVFADGEITQEPFVQDGSVGGFEAEVALGFALTERLELLASFWMRQFTISEGGGFGNPFAGDAAVDRYFGGMVGVGFTLPKI